MSKTSRHKIRNYLTSPFTLLDSLADRWFLVIFCGFFATFFINFYQPLNIDKWNYDSTLGNLLTVWSAGGIGALLLSFTQFVLRPQLKLATFKVGQFLGWVLLEFFLLTILFYGLFGESYLPFWQEFLSVFRLTVSLTIIPYFLACLLIAVKNLSAIVKKESTKTTSPLKQQIFNDENGKIILALNPTQLLLLKSENNYTAVFFIQNEKVEKKLIRTNLKKLEAELAAFSYLLRIHRSYMINLEKIESVEKKKGSFHIQLMQLPEMLLKVSETYKSNFKASLKEKVD